MYAPEKIAREQHYQLKRRRTEQQEMQEHHASLALSLYLFSTLDPSIAIIYQHLMLCWVLHNIIIKVSVCVGRYLITQLVPHRLARHTHVEQSGNHQMMMRKKS
jgi:hypothetical protein